MTEPDWLTAAEPRLMLAFLRANGRASARKLRLLVCACCRGWWAWLTDDRSRGAVAVAERFADGTATEADLTTAKAAARAAAKASRHAAVGLAVWAASLDAGWA